MIPLDTNVISEVLRTTASERVIAWLDRRFPECAVSSITILELGAGVALLPKRKRREALRDAIARMLRRFGPRVYGYDAHAAHASVKLLEQARAQGLGLQQIPAKLADLQIAGIALAYGMALATRNTRDFDGLGFTLIDPWQD